MPERERDRFDALPDPPVLGVRPVTQANVVTTVSELREALRYVLLCQRTVIGVSRDTDITATRASKKLNEIDGHLFGDEHFGPGILHDLEHNQRLLLKLAWTVLGFLIVGLIALAVALATHGSTVG